MHQLISREYLDPRFYNKIAEKGYANPTINIKDITELDPDLLESLGVRTIGYDADNTLFFHHAFNIEGEVGKAFLALARRFSTCIISNNNSPGGRRRLVDYFEEYSRVHGLDDVYVVRTQIKKPSASPFIEGLQHFGTVPRRAAMIGDNRLTDIVGANMLGMTSVKVQPLSPGSEPSIFGIARILERLYYSPDKISDESPCSLDQAMHVAAMPSRFAETYDLRNITESGKNYLIVTMDLTRLNLPMAGHVEIYWIGDERFYHFPEMKMAFRESPQLKKSAETLLMHLKGSEVEVDSTNAQRASNLFADWNLWKSEEQHECYFEDIHPEMLGAVHDEIMQKESGKIRIADLFCGDGKLSQSLGMYMGQKHNLGFYLADNDARLLSIAQKNMKGLNSSFTQVDLTTQWSMPEKIDIAMASGGLNRQVVTREGAVAAASSTYDALADTGIFIVAGYTPSVLNADDFRTIGFSVETMSLPKNVASLKRPYQFYVLRK
ncbi:MAG: HAD hydrolase-like protein [Nanoarchaeota archaeon]|nr:HAD hydrolase-like protein [Nanoarchaeota archaeon]